MPGLKLGILLGILFLASCGAIINAIGGEDQDSTVYEDTGHLIGDRSPRLQ